MWKESIADYSYTSRDAISSNWFRTF